MAIYIEHSNSEKELIQPQVVEYKPGQYGLKFTADKFSTFMILQIEAPTEEVAEEEEDDTFYRAPYIRDYEDGTYKPNRNVTRAEAVKRSTACLTAASLWSNRAKLARCTKRSLGLL